MPDYFFNERNDIPAGLGFRLFDATHLGWILGLAVFCFVLCILFYRLPANRQRKFAKNMVVLMIVSEVIKDIILIYNGRFSLSYLPLHICAISMFVCLWHNITNNEFAAEVTYAISLPGAVISLVFANWNYYPTTNFFALQSFLLHILVIAYPLMHVFSGKIRPRLRKLWMPTLFLVIVMPIIYFLNKFIGTNFLYLNYPRDGSPMSFFEGYLGNPGYIFGVALMVVIVWLVIYIPFYYVNINEKK